MKLSRPRQRSHYWHPVMLQLKEPEALETIAGNVERLTVQSGTGGLLDDLVKLRDSGATS